jgi:DNA-binding winged helix-turn-helix (wHTH) protein/tetratricopeptide (TPR) repeat protein
MEIPAKRLQFSSFTLDLDRLCLFGPSGRASLRPKSFDVLRYLVAHPRRVITKDELIKAVWPNVIVTDESLTRCISDVRHALGDESQQVIKTVPKRGYLLDLEVSVLGVATGAEPERDGARTPDDFFFPTEGPIVEVFPFAAISGDSRYANCLGGIAENIAAALSRCTWLTVIPAHISPPGNSGHRGKRPARPNYTLRGTAVHIGNCLRVTVHLLDALLGVQIWSDRFGGDTDEIFELHDRVTERVVAAIEPVLENAEFKRFKAKSIADLSPYDLVLRASVLEREFTKDSYTTAFRYLKQALAIDGSYAPALALEAFCRTFWVRQGWSTNIGEDKDEGAQLAIRSLEVGRNDPRVLSLSSIAIRSLANDAQRGLELATRSLELNPNSSMALSNAAWAHVYAGNPTRALHLFRRAEQINPYDGKAWFTAAAAGLAYFATAQYEEAVSCSKRALAQSPQFAPSLRTLAASLTHLDRVDEAAQVVPLLLKSDPFLTVEETYRQHRHMPEFILSRWLKGLSIAGLPK